MKPTYTLKPCRRTALTVVAVIVGLLAVVTFLRWPRFIADRLPFALPTPVEFTGEGAVATNFPLSHADPAPPATRLSGDDLRTAPDFLFMMGEGSGWHGIDVIKVGADGGCQYTYQSAASYDPATKGVRRPGWRRADFATDAGTVRDLRQLLADVDYGGLAKGYHANVHDGTQWLVKVQVADRGKGVYCNNHFPPEVVRLSIFIRDRIVGPHRAEIDAGGPVDVDQAAQWKEFEDGPVTPLPPANRAATSGPVEPGRK